MLKKIHHYSLKPYPKNFLLKRPAAGASIIALFNYLFLMIYRPVHTQPGYLFNYELTMAIYCLGGGVAAFAAILIVSHSGIFKPGKRWNILKEISAIILVIFAMGTAVFLLAFIVEVPGDRWNLDTIIDSYRLTFMIGGIPLYLFTILNFNYLFQSKLTHQDTGRESEGEIEEIITINTPLKKEELSFYPREFLYAESEGNYVNVYLQKGEEVRKEIIRISISSFEEQLSELSFIMRTHRAYIVNLKKVTEASGNSLGYRLNVFGVKSELPVSRRHTGKFRALYSTAGR
ncbi:MAG: hypothetical protein EA359_07985 [Balneolaceae bacterium]|nr:MAG: hypothetical protein EA359_07985 [Balneolaceae bacterium]